MVNFPYVKVKMDIMKRAFIYIGIFLLISFLLFVFLWNRKNSLENTYLLQKNKKIEAEFKAVLEGFDKLVYFFYEGYINQPPIKEVFYNASLNQEEIEKYRKEIIFLLKDRYETLKRYNIKYLTFFFPDGTAFIRFHNPYKSGDKLVINPISPEKNKTFGGFRYIYPVFYKKILVGSVEVVVSFGAIRKELNKLFNSEHRFLIKKDFIFDRLFVEERKNFVESDLSPFYFYESDIHYKSINRIQSEILSQINREIKDYVKDYLEKKLSFFAVAEVGDNYYTVSFIPIFVLTSQKKKHVGYLLTYEKDNSIAVYKSSLWISYVTTSSIVFLLLLMSFLLSYIKEKILIEEAADIDELEYALNEKTFYSLLGTEISRAKRYDRALSLIVIDFPSIKEAPEEKKLEVIKSLIGVLTENIRDTDYMSYIDNTQIGIILPETNIEEAKNIAERIKEVLEHTYIEEIGKPEFFIGVTEAVFSDTPESLLKRAKEALYLAQEKNKNIEIAN